MLKRITAWLLMVALLTSAMPVQTLAEKQYQKSFVVLPLSNIDEKPFRQWAASLVKAYKEEYTKGWRSDGLREFSKATYSFYEKKWNGWELYQQVFDECLYHPYYTLAKQKYAYNISKDANSEYNGEKMRSTEYTLMDEQELKGLHMWIIKETIQEKAKADPALFLQKVEGNDRLYSFSVKDGVMVRDPQLHTLEEKTVVNAWNDVGQFAVSALEVAIEAAYGWNELNGQAASLMNDAAAEAKGSNNFGAEFWKKFEKKLVDASVDFVCNTARDILKTANENFNASINNIMRTQMTSELLNSMLDCNSNIVAYLKSTYVENKSSLVVSSGESGQSFSATVEAVIDVLESDEFQKAIQTKAEITVTDVEYQRMLQSANIDMENVMSDSEMMAVIANKFFGNLLTYIISIFEDAFNSMIEIAKEEISNGKNESRMDQVFIKLLEAWAEFIEDLELRAELVVEEIIDELNKKLLAGEEFTGETITNVLKKYLFEFTDKTKPISDKALELLVDTGISIIFAVIGYQPKEEGNALKDPKKTMDLLVDIPTKLKDTNIAVGVAPENEIVVIAMVDGVMAAARVFVNEFKRCIDNNAGRISNEGLANMKKALATFDKALEGIERMYTSAVIEQKKSAEQLGMQLLSDLFTALADIIRVAMTLDEQELSAVWDSLGSMDVGSLMLTAVKTTLEDKDMFNVILKAVFGGSVKETQKTLIKTAGSKIDEKVKEKVEGLMKTVNATVEGTVEIVTDLWDTMMDCAADLARASNSVVQNLAGEHSASLIAERARQIYIQSNTLESANLLYTEGGRAEAYFKHGEYESFLNAFVIGENNDIRYLMNEEDILYHDLEYRWVLTPQLKDVKTLTDYIMTQMNLDAVGMGAYLTVLDGRSKFQDSTLYSKYFNKGVLMEEAEALNRYNRIVEMIDRFEGSRPEE